MDGYRDARKPDQEGKLSKGSVAERLKLLRSATGLTRKAVEASHDIKVPSLISWEKGHRIPKKDKAVRLASFFRDYGIPCTVEWILEGKGPDPLEEAARNPQESYLLTEVHRFRSFHADSLVVEAEDASMSPWINKGDFVGGLLVDLKKEEAFAGEVCIVQARDFGTRIRLVQKSGAGALYNLVSFSGKGDIVNVELEAVARVVFLRKV